MMTSMILALVGLQRSVRRLVENYDLSQPSATAARRKSPLPTMRMVCRESCRRDARESAPRQSPARARLATGEESPPILGNRRKMMKARNPAKAKARASHAYCSMLRNHRGTPSSSGSRVSTWTVPIERDGNRLTQSSAASGHSLASTMVIVRPSRQASNNNDFHNSRARPLQRFVSEPGDLARPTHRWAQ